MKLKVGILGGGQLAQLLALAAKELNIETLCLCERADEPASRYSVIMLDEGTHESLKKFAESVDVITLENENVNCERLAFLQQFKPVYPGVNAIAKSQDRLLEKTMFVDCGIPTVPFAKIASIDELMEIWQDFNKNAILKTRRFGYDGKGQMHLQQAEQIKAAWNNYKDQPLILEGFLPFDFEVSLIGARNVSGQTVFYPLIKNTHQAGILRLSEAPFVDAHLQRNATSYMEKLFAALDYVGVLAFEFFVKDRELYANEIAPRVHNSGHLTLEGANVSQFHLHLLSILDQPLPTPQFIKPTAMVNLIGTLPDREALLKAVPEAHVYDYGKMPRPSRKLGHITVVAPTAEILAKKIDMITRFLDK
jgi:5-(carboxyamino)imidazole ribonucleotide synthase